MVIAMLKLGVLSELKRGSLSGKGLREVISGKTGHAPSPGSLYPLLEDLYRNGYIDPGEGA